MRVTSRQVPTRPLGEGRGDQDPPKTPPGPPRTAPGPPKTPPGPPSGAPRCPPGPPGRPKMLFRSFWPNNVFRKNRKIRNRRPPRTTQNVFRSIWPNNLFRKNRKFEIVEKKSKKSRQRSSTVVTRIGPHKNRKHFQNGRTQRVAAVVARSALQ